MARRTTTRDRLIATAGELFWRQGYAGTGVNEIIKRAQATSGSFYHFFPTKDELLLAVLESVADRLDREVLEPAENHAPDAMERVRIVIEAYRRSAADRTTGYGLPVGALIGELGGNERARTAIGAIFGLLVDRIGGWLDRPTAALVVASLEGATVMAIAQGSTEPLDRCAGELNRMIGRSIDREHDRTGGLRPPAETFPVQADWRAW